MKQYHRGIDPVTHLKVVQRSLSKDVGMGKMMCACIHGPSQADCLQGFYAVLNE